MPSMLHEVLVALFRERPELAPELLRDPLGVEVPDYDEARLAEADLSQLLPTELRSDLVVLLHRGQPVLGIVVEVQLQWDADKRYTWPLYVTALRARHRCPCCLLVVAPDRRTASRAAQAIVLSPLGDAIRPFVVGPKNIPVIKHPEHARELPELALLSVQAHGRSPDGLQVGLAAAAAAVDLDRELAMVYYDQVLKAVGVQVRHSLEDTMRIENYEFESEFAKRHRAQGRVEGQLDVVLRLLELRGLELTDEQRARIRNCTDDELLQRWIERVLTVSSVDELFE